MILAFMEGKEKLLVPKLDSLLKHVGYGKCKVSILGVAVNAYFMKCVMFVTFYDIFAHCCPMINFEGFKALF
jgi:hypothetical protein